MEDGRTNRVLVSARKTGAKPLPERSVRERVVEGLLRDRVEEAGGRCVKFGSGGEVGWPDRVVLWPGGIAHFVEVKRPGKRPTKLQAYRLKTLRELGFVAIYLDSVETVEQYVRGVLPNGTA